MTKLWKFAVVAALVAAFGALVAVGLSLPAEEAVPRDYQCEVYTEQGCSKYVVASGGEIEVQSGGTIDLQAGSLMTIASAVDITNTLIVEGAAAFSSTIDAVGDISSSTGGVTITDDLIVTGTLNAHGNISSSIGGITITDDVIITGTLDTYGNILSTIGSITIADTLRVTDAVDFDSTVNIDGELTIDSVVISGPIRFGEATSIVSGSAIAHGLAVTPSAVFLTASGVVTAHPLVWTMCSTYITVGFLTESSGYANPPAMTIYWFAGK